ncbi:MAG: hypothetical protein E7Z89_05585 [Cyanobacteria bacterium SIG28]|nr:hypothetical protein [Cyanobacteria bacterium SIG28]
MNVKKIDGVIKTSSPVASRVRNAKQTVMDVFLREKELAKQKGDVFVRNMCDYHSDYDYLEPEIADDTSYSLDTDIEEVKLYTKRDNKFYPNKIFFEEWVYVLNKNQILREENAKRQEEGFSTEEIVNVIFASKLSKPADGCHINFELMDDGFTLLKQGQPLESVVNLMRENIITAKDGTQSYEQGLGKFLINCGDKKK